MFHQETPLRLPLVKQMLTDPIVRLVPRAIDIGWRNNKVIALTVAGFNPFLNEVFYARQSPLGEWLKTPTASARRFNSKDQLIRDLLLAVHDYLHVWGTRLIQKLAPQIGFGTARITRGNLEDQVFCQLVAETVATVGLDYWYLCTLDLNEHLPIGTRFTGGLTAPYQERHLYEFQRASPTLCVQKKEFFVELCHFYCSGRFLGFDVNDVQESPLLNAWLSHEIGYGQLQREISRAWFSYLAEEQIMLSTSQTKGPVYKESAWQLRLIEDAADALWRKVKQDEMMEMPSPAELTWQSPPGKPMDLRFRNANLLSEEELWSVASATSQAQFDYCFSQIVSRYDYGTFNPVLKKLLPIVREKKDLALLRATLHGQPMMPRSEDEPSDLLIIN